MYMYYLGTNPFVLEIKLSDNLTFVTLQSVFCIAGAGTEST